MRRELGYTEEAEEIAVDGINQHSALLEPAYVRNKTGVLFSKESCYQSTSEELFLESSECDSAEEKALYPCIELLYVSCKSSEILEKVMSRCLSYCEVNSLQATCLSDPTDPDSDWSDGG